MPRGSSIGTGLPAHGLLGRLNEAVAKTDEAEVAEVRRELAALKFDKVVTSNEHFCLWLAAFAQIDPAPARWAGTWGRRRRLRK